MLHPGLYEQLINRAQRQELDAIPAERKAIASVDPAEAAARFAERGIALRAGLHCAPLAHRTAGTFPAGTIRASVSSMTAPEDLTALVRTAKRLYF